MVAGEEEEKSIFVAHECLKRRDDVIIWAFFSEPAIERYLGKVFSYCCTFSFFLVRTISLCVPFFSFSQYSECSSTPTLMMSPVSCVTLQLKLCLLGVAKLAGNFSFQLFICQMPFPFLVSSVIIISRWTHVPGVGVVALMDFAAKNSFL